ncbi:hypothetical protein HDE_06616 [Halotydeus destructor]|nr:hypothetical protein HDE_06616 [Halotydeus destructor]
MHREHLVSSGHFDYRSDPFSRRRSREAGVSNQATVARSSIRGTTGSAAPKRNMAPMAAMMVCLIGASYQCLDATWEYTRYAVVSDLTILKAIRIIPPAFSLCMTYHNLVDMGQLMPGLELGSDKDVLRALQENVQIKDIMKALPNLTTDRTLKYRMSRQSNSYDINENGDALCPLAAPIRSKHVTYGRDQGSLMKATFDRANLSHVSAAVFYLHPANKLPRGDRDFRVVVGNKEGTHVFAQNATYWSLSYREIELHRLAKPYQGGCRDFPAEGYEGYHHCQLRCTHKQAIKGYGMSLFTLTHSRPKNFTVINKYSIISNATLRREAEDWDLGVPPEVHRLQLHRDPLRTANRVPAGPRDRPGVSHRGTKWPVRQERRRAQDDIHDVSRHCPQPPGGVAWLLLHSAHQGCLRQWQESCHQVLSLLGVCFL